MSDCPLCASMRQVITDAEAATTEEHLKAEAALRAAAAERKRADLLQAKLERQHEEDAEAPVVRACLDVWAQHCYAGTRKASIGLNSKRAELIRAALKWQRIGAEDICDGFRGLGLLPYRDRYNERSATAKPGYTRKTDVSEILRDEERLERFRDYYRRVQATPANRLLEQWEQARVVTDALFLLVLKAQGKELADERRSDAQRGGHLFVVEGGKAA